MIVNIKVPAIALGYERSESDIMKRPPRHPTQDRMCGIKLVYKCLVLICLTVSNRLYCA